MKNNENLNNDKTPKEDVQGVSKTQSKDKKRKTVISVVATLCSLVLIGVGLITWAFAPHKGSVAYIAHRGYAENSAYKNTIVAYENAAKSTYFGIETDVHATSDGVIVCNHDEDVVFNDGSNLKIATSTYAQLTQKPLKGTNDVYICTFEDYLKVCARYLKLAVVELKPIFNTAQIGKIMTLIATNYIAQDVYFISFEMANLLACRNYNSFENCLYLTKTAEGVQQAYENNFGVDVYWKTINNSIVKQFHAKGLKVGVWTVNNRFVRTYMDTLSVDFLTSDVFR